MPTPDLARASPLVHAHGREATSFQTLCEEFSWHFDGAHAAVAYLDVGGAWVAAGSPFAAPTRQAAAARHFVEAARARGRRPVFFATEHALDLVATPIGADAVWAPERWAATLRGAPGLREQLRRARARGVHAQLLDAHGRRAWHEAIEALLARWQAARGLAPMGFLVRLDPFARPHERRLIAATREGALVGLAVVVPVPARHGLFVEHLLRDPGAPNGTVELLFDAAMQLARREERELLTLGLAPLAGEVPVPLRLARRLGRPLYDFEGLRAFKAKLRPTRWEPRFLLREPRTGVVPAFRAALAAFAGGGLLDFGVRTATRLVGMAADRSPRKR